MTLPASRTHSGLLVLVTFALVLATGGACGPSRHATYTVHLADPVRGRVEVELALDGLDPRQPITLASRTSPADARFDAGPVAVTPAPGALVARAGNAEEARFEFAPPGATRAVLRYAVSIPPPAHGGMSGEGRASAVVSRFALLCGRDLFLVPDHAGRFAAPEVRFRLPAGWRAVAPWIDGAIGNDRPVSARHGYEEMLQTVLAFGRFTPVRFAAAGTPVVAWFDAGIPVTDRDAAARRLRRLSTYVAEAFARPLGGTYTIVVVPALDDHGTPTGDAWGSGQGSGLWPLTPTRLRTIAAHLADAHLLVRPYRFELADPRDRWLVPALRVRIADGAAARELGVSADALDRVFAYRYASLPGTTQLDLERIASPAPTDEDEQQVAEAAGAYVLRRLDRTLASRGSPVLAALRRASRNDRVRSFWSQFDPSERTAADAFRARYVQGGEVLDVSADRERSALTAAPPAQTGPAVRSLKLAITSQMLGHLEHCGCKANPAGGVARRTTLLSRLRAERPGLVVLDAGSGFGNPGMPPELDAFGRAELGHYLDAVHAMKYDALAIGYTELGRGPTPFQAMTAGRGLPYACANVERAGRLLAPAVRIVRAGDMTLRIVGAYEPPGALQRSNRIALGLDSVRVEDTVAAVARATAGAGPQELVIVLGELSPRTMRAIEQRCPEVDVFVTAPVRIRGELSPAGTLPRGVAPSSGFLGHAYVVCGDLGEYGIVTADLGIAASGRVAKADLAYLDLDESVPEDKAVRHGLDRFYATIARTDLASAAIAIPFADDPLRNTGGYVGRAACAGCHAKESAQWATTGHANAYRTLLEARRAFQPRCVSCHVVGYGLADGFTLERPQVGLVDVQCEVCHGPGAAHARNPRAGSIARAVPERVCLTCHTPDHSDAFNYALRLPRVMHGGEAKLAMRH